MKKEELIIGEIYHTEQTNETNKHIFKYLGGDLDGCQNFCITNNKYTVCTRYFDNSFVKNLRLATQQEKNWLNSCIQANKFIPLSEVNQIMHYEIY